MSGVDRVLHRLKPVAVELGLDHNSPSTVFPHPQVVFRNERSWLRPHVGPVKTDKFLYRVGRVLHSKTKLASCRLRGGLQAVAADIIEPTVIGTSDASLLNPAVGEGSPAVRTSVREQTDPS